MTDREIEPEIEEGTEDQEEESTSEGVIRGAGGREPGNRRSGLYITNIAATTAADLRLPTQVTLDFLWCDLLCGIWLVIAKSRV